MGVPPRRRLRSLVLAAALAGLLQAGLSGCGSAHPRATPSTGASSTTRGSAGSGTTTVPQGGAGAGLTISPPRPATTSELTFAFTAPVASGVHGRHVIGYSLSVVGPVAARCAGTHETGAPPVGRGASARIVVGPTELHAPWCPGRYVARVIELSSAHCTGTAPCPQYVRVVRVLARGAFTIHRS